MARDRRKTQALLYKIHEAYHAYLQTIPNLNNAATPKELLNNADLSDDLEEILKDHRVAEAKMEGITLAADKR